ncbi:C40 family peptidase [Pseudomonas pseudonitroreducens]|uniref:C40 family peptidase n=1 Tax=Pseudomonas pseudonitroreducens TaxID=2892326 RepID=UPI001F3FA51E|nr:C40 family peptidase [Pseudomonas pseudonitroreducens]
MRPLCWLPLYLLCTLGAPVALADDFDAPDWRRYDTAAIDRSFQPAGHVARIGEPRGAASRTQGSLQRISAPSGTQQRTSRLLSTYSPEQGDRNYSPVDTTRIVERAHELIGTPYRWGGATEESGFDCSGLLVYLYGTIANRKLPRTTTSMVAQKRNAVDLDQLQPGDAVFFNHDGNGRTSHVGLYIGDGQFIHAPRTGKTIRIDSLDDSYWQRRYTTARRFSG